MLWAAGLAPAAELLSRGLRERGLPDICVQGVGAESVARSLQPGIGLQGPAGSPVPLHERGLRLGSQAVGS